MGRRFTTGGSSVYVTEQKDQILVIVPDQKVTVRNEFHDPNNTNSTPTKEVWSVTLHILTGKDAGVHYDSLIYPANLQGTVSRGARKGLPAVGRLGQRPNRKSPKGKPEWILLPMTPEDEALINAYLDSHPEIEKEAAQANVTQVRDLIPEYDEKEEDGEPIDDTPF